MWRTTGVLAGPTIYPTGAAASHVLLNADGDRHATQSKVVEEASNAPCLRSPPRCARRQDTHAHAHAWWNGAQSMRARLDGKENMEAVVTRAG